MTNGKDLIERRKHRRFRVKYGTFAIFCSNVNRLGQIIDISRGGLSFRYFFDSEEWSEETPCLDLLASEDNFYLEKIPCSTVCDCVTANGLPGNPIIMKRRSMQFGDLSAYQVSQLNFFIKNNTLAQI